MEERAKKQGGFFDEENLLVDRAIADPFLKQQIETEIQSYPFEDSQSAGYIRYTFRNNAIVIIDCVITKEK